MGRPSIMRSTFSGTTLGCPSNTLRATPVSRSTTINAAFAPPAGMRSGVTSKLVGWDTKAAKLHRVIYLLAPIAPMDAFVNDFTVDSRHNRIFIVDPIVEHPDDSIDVGADGPEPNPASGRNGFADRSAPCSEKESENHRPGALRPSNRALVRAHYESAASGDCHVSWSL